MLPTFRLMIVALVAWLGWISQPPGVAQEVDIWEYSPYNVGVWMSLDPSIDKSPEAREQLINDVKEELARTFGAAWKTQFMEVPANMSTLR